MLAALTMTKSVRLAAKTYNCGIMTIENEDLIRLLAKQAYRHQLLVKALHASGHLRPQEPDSLWDAEEFKAFLNIFRGNYFSGKIRKSGDSDES
jgi:hypothetical protein